MHTSCIECLHNLEPLLAVVCHRSPMPCIHWYCMNPQGYVLHCVADQSSAYVLDAYCNCAPLLMELYDSVKASVCQPCSRTHKKSVMANSMTYKTYTHTYSDTYCMTVSTNTKHDKQQTAEHDSLDRSCDVSAVGSSRGTDSSTEEGAVSSSPGECVAAGSGIALW